MFLRSKGIAWCPAYRSLSKRLLSNKIREVLNTRLEPPVDTNPNQLQLAVVSKNLNAVNLDLFVNNLSNYDDRRLDVLNLLASLRLTKSANSCLESTHFAVVRHLLENSSVQELVPVLLDRPQYGIFLNNFTGFAVTHTLHDEKEYILGLPLALKLVLLDEVDSKFVQTFCLKASLEALKKELSNNETSEDKEPSPPKGKVQEKKIRVKYLRNEQKVDQHLEMGKAILKVTPKVLEGNARDNANILSLVLRRNFTELDNILGTKSIEIMADISNICKVLLSRGNQTDLANKIDKMQTTTLFGELVEVLLKETADKETTSLAEKQIQLLTDWQKLRNERKLEMEREMAEKERIENIGKFSDEIATKKELLWFFDHEDRLDLEIYNKRVFYPKRWFGKKKKPRVVDENYVPPHIRKID